MGFVWVISAVLVTGIVVMLVRMVVLVSVVGTVIIDDFEVMTVDVTGHVVVLHGTVISASDKTLLVSQGGVFWEKLTLRIACLL